MNIIDAKYKYVFVGGKGGVGKTTTSCSLAIQIANRTEGKILIISTDPAHNLSDAFGQQFSTDIMKVNGTANLFAVELDPSKKSEDLEDKADALPDALQKISGLLGSMGSIPGIDEVMNFMMVMKLAENDDYETVIFDTAPTGHTMHFLEVPTTAMKLFETFESMSGMIGPVAAMMGGNFDIGELTNTLRQKSALCRTIKERFEDPLQTTFICVCIPEFLSLYETERLVQHLARCKIDCNTVVCNQVLNVGAKCQCGLCKARSRMQGKYLKQMDELYEDFTLIKMPLLEQEVRGLGDLQKFGQTLCLVGGFPFEQ